ncbi:MAG TPA: flagellar hook-associated protein FlgL [Sandaracinaceae bacterium LLY-WYZ-13_1]|nr:flagellar hook-associated protein FlgL [Sandaracinaceae bacterium LLY-WYZ-13_1]
MRVSDSMMSELVQRGLEQNRQSYFEAQQVASTGVRVAKPSDDPVAAGLSRGTRSRERRYDTVAKLSAEGIERLQAVDDTLGQVGGVLSRARELAVLGSNDHLSASDRNDLATEVGALRQQLLSLANTKVGDEHVFGGLAVDAPPFDATGAFVGETTLREIEVGPGARVPVQVSGADVFGATGTDAFATLDTLAAALSADDRDAVHATLDELDATVAQAASGRTAAGLGQQRLAQAKAAAERLRQQAVERHAALTEADPFEAFSDLVKTENALREAVSIAARMPPPSLLEMGG